MDRFCKNKWRLKVVHYFDKRFILDVEVTFWLYLYLHSFVIKVS